MERQEEINTKWFQSLSVAEAASQVSFAMIKNLEYFNTEEEIRDEIALYLVRTGLYTEAKAKEISSQVEVGLLLQKDPEPLVHPQMYQVQGENKLKKLVLAKAQEAFIPIFGAKEGVLKAEEFVLLLMGDEEQSESSLFHDMKKILEKQKQELSLERSPHVVESLLLQKMAEELANKAHVSFDKFILHQALMENGKQLLGTVHDLLLQNSDEDAFRIQLPV